MSVPSNYSVIDSIQLANTFRNIWEPNTIDDYESVYCLFFNQKNEVIYKIELNRGTEDHVLFNTKKAVKLALNTKAKRIAIAHNHTGENSKPSDFDIVVTDNFKTVLTSVGVDFMDHIILTVNDYFSFRDNGMF
jgi:DNA repair protein RadC